MVAQTFCTRRVCLLGLRGSSVELQSRTDGLPQKAGIQPPARTSATSPTDFSRTPRVSHGSYSLCVRLCLPLTLLYCESAGAKCGNLALSAKSPSPWSSPPLSRQGSTLPCIPRFRVWMFSSLDIAVERWKIGVEADSGNMAVSVLLIVPGRAGRVGAMLI